MKTGKLIRGLLLLLPFAVIPRAVFGQDNPSVTGQLNDAKVIVARIKSDAVQMESYSKATGLSWQTHSQALSKIKDDVNKLQANMRGLQSHRTIASPWQQDAIDRITGLANDLATNMNATIDQLNKSKSRPTAAPYPDYLKANATIAKDLADEIDDTIEAGQTKANMDALQKQLPQ